MALTQDIHKFLVQLNVLNQTRIRKVDEAEFLIKAEKHYCGICNQFFKNAGGCTSHKKIKHPSHA